MTTIIPLMLYLSANFLQPRNLECLNKNILLPGMKDKRALGTCKFQCYKHSLYNGTILTAPIYEVKEIMIHETGRHPEWFKQAIPNVNDIDSHFQLQVDLAIVFS